MFACKRSTSPSSTAASNSTNKNSNTNASDATRAQSSPRSTLSSSSSASSFTSRLLSIDHPSSAASTPSSTSAYIDALHDLQQLVAELLNVHVLSSAIEYDAHAPLAVNARAWWRDVEQTSLVAAQRRRRSPTNSDAAVAPFEVCANALLRVLETLDRVNRVQATVGTADAAVECVVESTNDAIAFAARELLVQWDALVPAASSAAVAIVNVLLQFRAVGTRHAFHPHVLVPSAVKRVFPRATTTWKCSVCTRQSDIKGLGAPPLVFRCAPCSFHLCRECFTRIPNASTRFQTPTLEDDAYAPLSFHSRTLDASRFLTLALDGLTPHARFYPVVGALGHAVRQRIVEMPLHRASAIASTSQLLVEMLASRSAALAIVEFEPNDWFPVYMNTWMMAHLSFLGPFVRATRMTDEAPSSLANGGATVGFENDWKDGFHALQTTIVAIFESLLASSQSLRVQHATLAWLGCTVLSTATRRRLNRDTNDGLDGFLINVATALVTLSLPHLDADAERQVLDNTYHTSAFSRRAFGDKHVREAPLRDLASVRGDAYVETKRCVEIEQQRARDRTAIDAYTKRLGRSSTGNAPPATPDDTIYYPVRDAHYGVACNHCYEQNFTTERYKCAFCDDVDICGTCFALFAAQSLAARGRIDQVLLTSGLDQPQVHMLDHVFLRVSSPVPLYETRHFEMIPFEKPAFRRRLDAADDVNQPRHAVLFCATCRCDLTTHAVVFKCSNCFDARFVCVACVVVEEAALDPHRMHVPGHLYFALTSAWRATYDANATALRYVSLSHPSALLPRNESNPPTELLFLAMKALHFGPLLTLSKLVAQLKELFDLRAFCFCDDERVAHETKLQYVDQTGPLPTRRTTIKRSSHYSASKARIVELSDKVAITELHLLDAATVASWLTFYGKTSRWLLTFASSTEDAHATVLTDVSDTLMQFPEHFVTDLCDVVFVLGLDRLEFREVWTELCRHCDHESVVIECVITPLFVLLTQLVASREVTRNPHVRVQALKALVALFAFCAKHKHNAIVQRAFATSTLLQQALAHGVLSFHLEMESYHVRNNGLMFNSAVSSGDHLLWGFLPTRVSVSLLLRFLWQLPSQRRVLTALLHVGSSPIASEPTSQLRGLVSGLWNDVAKLLDEGTNKIETLVQLRELQLAARDASRASAASLPFRPAMIDGYIALHTKQLRLTFRMLTEALELLTWMSDSTSFKRVLLQRELVEQCARITSFVLATLAAAFERRTWRFSQQLERDARFVIANVVLLVVRCAGLGDACAVSSTWTLVHESGAAMVQSIGDLDTRVRFALSAAATQLESADVLGDTTARDDAVNRASDNSNHDVHEEDESEDELDEDAALARLEKQAADAVVAAQLSPIMRPRHARRRHAQSRLLAQRFIASLAQDGRFDYERFTNALALLASVETVDTPPCLDASWIVAFDHALVQCRDVIALHASIDAFLGDVPDEYLDPLLNTIMTDPVRLPSGQIVDRAVIERHLLASTTSSATPPVDPFTREPLTIAMLVPCDALRREIRLFVRSKMQHFTSGEAQGEEAEEEAARGTWGLGWDSLFATSDDFEEGNGDGDDRTSEGDDACVSDDVTGSSSSNSE